jgi:hypothetical protein
LKSSDQVRERENAGKEESTRSALLDKTSQENHQNTKGSSDLWDLDLNTPM